MSSFRTVVSSLIPQLQALRGKLWHWSIEDRATGRRMEAFGSPHARAMYHGMFFAPDAVLTRRLVVHAAGAHRAIRRAHARSALVVVNGIPLPPDLADAGLAVPRFVNMTLSLPPRPDVYLATLGSSAQNDLQRVRSEGFQPRVTRDPAWVETYHARYHVPSMRQRHGERTIVYSPAQLRRWLESGGEFVQVMAGETCVAASLAVRKDHCMYFRAIGWRDGDVAWVQKRCVAACYWFMVQRAFEVGCTELDFGGCPPFAESGLLNYKRKWGAALSAARTTGPIDRVLVNESLPGGREFLTGRSLFVRQPNGSLTVRLTRKDDAQR
ncbi:MAG: GNAT family N-acetyltransferase [Opitutus sp.]|nr:GNAT family N-acetyltransferase [Opitutus sp.]